VNGGETEGMWLEGRKGRTDMNKNVSEKEHRCACEMSFMREKRKGQVHKRMTKQNSCGTGRCGIIKKKTLKNVFPAKLPLPPLEPVFSTGLLTASIPILIFLYLAPFFST
jgi:hypothetical protein